MTSRPRPKLLDLFCGAGGAAMGYHRAGFDVVGVDIKPMPRYPFEFHQADALEYLEEHGKEFDAIHASPPCQAYTAMQHICKNSHNHPDLVDPTRNLLDRIGRPYVIENVIGAPIRVDIMLCGTMLGLPIIRHRWFECNWSISPITPPCNHTNVYDPWHGEGGIKQREKLLGAMNIDWDMTRPEVRNAIPPAYTEFIGRQLMRIVEVENATTP